MIFLSNLGASILAVIFRRMRLPYNMPVYDKRADKRRDKAEQQSYPDPVKSESGVRQYDRKGDADNDVIKYCYDHSLCGLSIPVDPAHKALSDRVEQISPD